MHEIMEYFLFTENLMHRLLIVSGTSMFQIRSADEPEWQTPCSKGRSYVNLNGSTQLNSCDSDLLTQPNYPDSDRHVAQKFRVHATCKLPRLSNLRSNSIRWSFSGSWILNSVCKSLGREMMRIDCSLSVLKSCMTGEYSYFLLRWRR